MATTLGKFNPATSELNALMDESDSDRSCVSDYADESDSDEGFAKRRSRSRPEPPAKRRNMTTTTKATAKAARHNTGTGKGKKPATNSRKDLCPLPEMPLDIVYEILGLLSPVDLLSLSRANKTFREMVVGEDMDVVWKGAREKYEAPPPPAHLNEAQWAGLLFEMTCESCGREDVREIDWGLQKRVCVQCKKKHFILDLTFEHHYPNYDVEILEYLPYSKRGGWSDSYISSTSRYYWDKDVHVTAKIWKDFQRGIERRRPRAVEGFEAWKRSCKQIVKSVDQMEPTYARWAVRFGEIQQQERLLRLEWVKARFMEMGYLAADINGSITPYSPGIESGIGSVSNAVWNRVKPKLEAEIQAKRDRRLMSELNSRIKERMNVLDGVYTQYLSGLKPSERYLCPPVQAFRPIPSVAEIIEASSLDLVVTAQHFEHFVDHLPEYITHYHEQKRQMVMKALLSLKADDEAVCLDLAKYVFKCQDKESDQYCYVYVDRPCMDFPRNRVLLGWNMIKAHSCVGSKTNFESRPGVWIVIPRGIIFDDTLSIVSKNLIVLAGLDPDATTIEDMDKNQAYFVCGGCASRRLSGYEVFTWRGALYHCAINHLRKMSTFRLANPDEAETARALDPSIKESAKAWACNHCDEFADWKKCQMKAVVLDHLEHTHGITEPKLSEDYFLNERCRFTFENPCYIPRSI